MTSGTSGNGEKSKIIAWLLGVLQTIIFAILGWLGTNAVQAKSDIAVLQANYQTIDNRLAKIEDKLDRALRQEK